MLLLIMSSRSGPKEQEGRSCRHCAGALAAPGRPGGAGGPQICLPREAGDSLRDQGMRAPRACLSPGSLGCPSSSPGRERWATPASLLAGHGIPSPGKIVHVHIHSSTPCVVPIVLMISLSFTPHAFTFQHPWSHRLLWSSVRSLQTFLSRVRLHGWPWRRLDSEAPSLLRGSVLRPSGCPRSDAPSSHTRAQLPHPLG